MSILINPGSGPVKASGNGWVNDYAGAEANAREWYDRMVADGIRDVELALPGTPTPGGDGRWIFDFTHTVSGAVVQLEVHGLDDDEYRAYEREWILGPRTYWNGSSSDVPEVEQFAAPGFEVVKTLRPVAGTGGGR
jgi:hypothetical protein